MTGSKYISPRDALLYLPTVVCLHGLPGMALQAIFSCSYGELGLLSMRIGMGCNGWNHEYKKNAIDGRGANALQKCYAPPVSPGSPPVVNKKCKKVCNVSLHFWCTLYASSPDRCTVVSICSAIHRRCKEEV